MQVWAELPHHTTKLCCVLALIPLEPKPFPRINIKIENCISVVTGRMGTPRFQDHMTVADLHDFQSLVNMDCYNTSNSRHLPSVVGERCPPAIDRL